MVSVQFVTLLIARPYINVSAWRMMYFGKSSRYYIFCATHGSSSRRSTIGCAWKISTRTRLISLELDRHMKCSLQVFHIIRRRIARHLASHILSPYPSPRQLAIPMSLEKNRESVEQTEHHAVEDEQEFRRKPYFGMTGTQLNIWMTVACTTAMTLFGEPVASLCPQS